ncbi:uncharacterized protein TRUGW13939_00113 [Talaromyces rugulosus]|uniref:Rhodopsin domain-containing protein n=1 Tax=Talaromyces rugulosus TaxID=121627 RepID=A0A7H8QHJ7_TALRU|nr:uncharacterized protein TRUGW13939_00113 [Talaromyces rugulosus]QKX53042.1 hypothetical protein TRUGW13939_00113 [Talaromyces rugulosus]
MVYEKISTPHIRSEIPPNDNDALLYIIVSLCIIIIVIELVFRAYSAYSWQRQRNYVKCDDVVFFVAAGLAICQFTLVIVQVKHGWGKSHIRVWGVYRRSQTDTEVMNKTAYAADLFYVTILACSKVCAILFNRDIFRYVKRVSEWMSYGILLLCGATWIVSVVVLAVRCTSAPWADINQQCSSFFSHWQVVTALDIITETVILSYPIVCLYKVQMSNRQKFRVLVAMNCRILLIPLSALHLHFIHRQYMSLDPSVDGIFSTSMAVIHILFSLVVLIGSSLKGVVSINNRHCDDFVAPLPPKTTSSVAELAISRQKLDRPRSTHSFLPATSSDVNEDPKLGMLDLPQAPYACKPLALSHETWPRWSVIEEEDEEEGEEAVTPAITHDEQDREEIQIQLLPPPPVLRRDNPPFYFAHERGNSVAVGESSELMRV